MVFSSHKTNDNINSTRKLAMPTRPATVNIEQIFYAEVEFFFR